PPGAPPRTRGRPRTCWRAGWPAGAPRRSRVADESERTSEEREAARREREAARSQRAGVLAEQSGASAEAHATQAEPFDDEDGGEDDLHHVGGDEEYGFHEGNEAGLGAARAEAPAGTRRITRSEQRSIRPHAPRPVRRRPPQSRRRGRWRARLGALIVFIAVGALVW